MRYMTGSFGIAAALCLWVVAALPGLANDSTASLDTGGLVLVPNADIRLEEEDLFISPDLIRVRYVFFNTSDQAIRTPVAFPLPPLVFGEDMNYAISPEDPVNFVGFRLWVDGQRMPFQIDARASTGDGRDITGLLAKYDIPITTFTADEAGFMRLRARLDALPGAAMDELRAAGAIHGPDWGDGFQEAWSANVAFYWMQSFAPRSRVVIEHSYRPVPAHGFYGRYDLEARYLFDEACIDDSFAAGARRRMAGTEMDMLGATILRYVLVTANNWRGPIGRFRLTVDKGSTDAIVSLCRDGIRKTGPTSFEWEGFDFRPDRDLTLLFLAPLPTE